MSTEKTTDFALTSREIYILGQALELAKKELKKVNANFREDINILDMFDLQNKFPFTGEIHNYNFEVIIQLKDNNNSQIETIKKAIEEKGIDCKCASYQIL